MPSDHIVVKTPWLKDVVLCFLFTGLRISDVVGLKHEVVGIKGARLIATTKKRGKRVSLELHPELVAQHRNSERVTEPVGVPAFDSTPGEQPQQRGCEPGAFQRRPVRLAEDVR